MDKRHPIFPSDDSLLKCWAAANVEYARAQAKIPPFLWNTLDISAWFLASVCVDLGRLCCVLENPLHHGELLRNIYNSFCRSKALMTGAMEAQVYIAPPWTVDVSFQTPGVDRYTWKGSEITTLVRTLLDLTKSVQNFSCCESMRPTAGVHTYHSPRCKTSQHERTLSFKLRPIKDWSIPFQYTRDSSSSADFIIFLWSCLVFISDF